jgi:hypothetical protein
LILFENHAKCYRYICKNNGKLLEIHKPEVVGSSKGKLKMPRIAIVLGTLSEILKMSPVNRACERQTTLTGIISSCMHTGQHYSYNMDRVFFEQLELPEASII